MFFTVHYGSQWERTFSFKSTHNRYEFNSPFELVEYSQAIAFHPSALSKAKNKSEAPEKEQEQVKRSLQLTRCP